MSGGDKRGGGGGNGLVAAPGKGNKASSAQRVSYYASQRFGGPAQVAPRDGRAPAIPSRCPGRPRPAPRVPQADGKRSGKSTKESEAPVQAKEVELNGVKLTVPLEINTRILCKARGAARGHFG